MHGRRQRQRAARRRPLAGGDDVGLLEFGQHPSAGRGIALAGLAQLDRPRRPMQQLGADPRLEEGDGAADRRRRAAELAAAPARLPSSSADDEDLHRIDTIHDSSRAATDPGKRPSFGRIQHRRSRHSFAWRKSVCRTASIRSIGRNGLIPIDPIGAGPTRSARRTRTHRSSPWVPNRKSQSLPAHRRASAPRWSRPIAIATTAWSPPPARSSRRTTIRFSPSPATSPTPRPPSA